MSSSLFDRLGLLLTPEQVALLEQCYPHRCPDPAHSERELWMKAGERRLVDVLKAKYEAAHDNILKV
jgi:hypothetical protein